MESINNLLTDANSAHKKQLDEGRMMTSKWENTGLLEGIGNEYEKSGMAILLENQARQLIDENSKTGGSNAEEWSGVALPLVRRIFGEIAAKDFVSVQPMNLPSGLVFFLDFKYGSAFSDRTVGENMYGNVSTANSKMAVDTDVSGGLYGAGAFGYSSKSGSIGSAALSFHAVTQSATSQSVGYQDGTLPSDYVVIGHTFSTSDEIDLLGVRAFQFVSGSDAAGSPNAAPVGGFVTNYPQWTRIATETSPLRVEFTLKKSDISLNVKGGISGSIFYYKQPADNTRGDFEDNPAGSIAIPEINVELASESIVAKTKKLKAQWTPEFSQDLNAYHSIDAEAELTSLLSEYISMEIDLEILDMLIQGAVTTERWSAASNKNWTGTKWETSGAGAGGFYNTQGQWFQTLGTKIQKVSNKIHQKTLRGGANFLVCSPSVATILESIPGYAANTDGDKMDFAFGVQKVGSLNGRYKVYKNPYMTENTILTGYRGSQFLETGAVYAPYVPLMMTPLVYDPQTFTPRKGIMTRYAKKMIRPEFYGKIFVADLATV